MKTIRITGVPEHFNFPWKKVVKTQPFLKQGIQLDWTDESRGSGQMNKALRNNETDIALVLTESFLQDFENGNPSKIIGYHVLSPLIWGIHTHGNSPVTQLSEIKEPNFLISRIGSGSHLMTFVLAKKENWKKENMNFKVIGNLPGALESMDPQLHELFLWEKYTTKPWVDSGEMKRIGEVPSPWPCFVMVASDKAITEFGETIFNLRDLVYDESNKLQHGESSVEDISRNYDLNLQDVREWHNQTVWATKPDISRVQLMRSMQTMKELGILKEKLQPEKFLSLDNLSITN
ncbi:ABC transporter substrate-binding protein [Algoriphagus sp. AGSA1]|uniref:ABC transporter substrate-binding protein n=1 Tax=Algoriphagus sp. AGSA1 TaxID=2907213 RepID=UPI001F15868D|nr:ABC transporter substrate-binding protein [Algoriphagus sp. AGSA1]MCE7053847.1 ABC transporter substrate-binding protein [Algoriphagus sp. AGSA1]